MERERLGKAMWKRVRTTTVRAIGAVDIALWDIAGKAACLPVHSLLGSYRDRVPAYISSAVLPSAQAYADEAQHYRSLNLAAYKIHPPQSWQGDIKVCEAVRKAVGDEYLLMLDAAWSYDYGAALRVGLAVQDLGYYWYEDPLADADIYNYVELKKHLHIPIMATEYPAGGLDSFTPWIKERATDFLRGDVAVKGGITTLMKAAHLAEAFHLNFELHHGGNSLNNFANLHVIMALQNTEFFEVLLPAESQKYGLVQDIEIDAGGFVHAPTGPGIGAHIDFELIERKKVAVLA
jgi:L-alanine-DL-glutamate epimerase-like enolase superfamily enzyme